MARARERVARVRGVVDGAEARGDLVVLQVAGGQVEPGEQPVGGDVQHHERTGDGPQPAHRGGGGKAVAGDVADDQRRASAGERHHVVPVAAHPVRVDGGRVVGMHPQAGGVRGGAREEGALEREDVLALTPVEPCVVHEHGCHGSELGRQLQIGPVEGRTVPGAYEVGGSQQDAAGDQRHGQVAVDALTAHRRLRAVRRRDEREVLRCHPADQHGPAVAQAFGGQQRLAALPPVHHLAHRGGFELLQRVDGPDRHGTGDGHRGSGDALALLTAQHGLQQVDGGGVGQPGTLNAASSSAVRSRSRVVPIRVPAALSQRIRAAVVKRSTRGDASGSGLRGCRCRDVPFWAASRRVRRLARPPPPFTVLTSTRVRRTPRCHVGGRGATRAGVSW